MSDFDHRARINELSDTIGPGGRYAVYSLHCGPPADDVGEILEEMPPFFDDAARADIRYYVGFTSNVYKRIEQHFDGQGAEFTKAFPPVDIVQIEWFDKRFRARGFEGRLAEKLRYRYRAELIELHQEKRPDEVVIPYVYQF
ncbi:MAG: GIY-YIG nuclease family protein [Halobacteriales archaeon]|nr:GIY-YIG nuclease family protein [Halobacteriales archaeon]